MSAGAAPRRPPSDELGSSAPRPRRRLRRDRRGELQRQPALGRQHPHHQRRVPLPPLTVIADRPPRPPERQPAHLPRRRSAPTSSRTWSARRSTRPPRRCPPRTRSRCAGRPRIVVRRLSRPRWDSPPADRDRGAARPRGSARRDASRGPGPSGRRAVRLRRARPGHARSSGTSTGLRLRHDQPTGRVELNAKSADRGPLGLGRRRHPRLHRRRHRGGWTPGCASASTGPSGRSTCPPGGYETLLPPTAVADLMIYLYWSAGGAGRRGRPDGVQQAGRRHPGRRAADHPACHAVPAIRWQPACGARRSSSRMRPGLTPRSSTTGCRCSRTAWIHDGSLAALHSTRHSAALAGLPFTPAIDNLTLATSAAGAPTLEEMVSSTGRALLLTCLWYIREVDPQTLLLTGLTRDGVYLVEDGEVVGAVNNFRFNESPGGHARAAGGGRRHRTHPAARMGRLLQPRRDAAGAGRGLQHVLGQPGQLSAGRLWSPGRDSGHTLKG